MGTEETNNVPVADNSNDEKNKFKKFVNNAIGHLSNLTRLEVNTLVGNFTFNKKGNVLTSVKQDSTEERMTSQINLLTGDITTAMTGKFVDEYKDLREYHLVREAQGHKIIEQNINTLRGIVEALTELTAKKDELDKA